MKIIRAVLLSPLALAIRVVADKDELFSLQGRGLRRKTGGERTQDRRNEGRELTGFKHEQLELGEDLYGRLLHYDEFSLSMPTMPTENPTKSPVTAPPFTAPPFPAPTEAPVPSPTDAPFSAPTNAPTFTLPIPPPSPAPTDPPTATPTEARSPTGPPTGPATDPPTTSPTEFPTPELITDIPTVTPGTQPPLGTLYDIICTEEALSTLKAAIETADANRNIPPFLADILSGSTMLTAFAPTNEAFAVIEMNSPELFEMLLTPPFGLHLFDLIAYHVAMGVFLASFFPLTNLQMLAAGTVNVTVEGNSSFVESFSPLRAQVVVEDVLASNGVAQVVDNVLGPRFLTQNLVDYLVFTEVTQAPIYTKLLRLVTAAGLAETIAGLTDVTLLAPINEGIPQETEDFLLAPGNEEILTEVLLYHIIDEVFNYADQQIPNILLVSTLQMENIVVGIVEQGDGSVSTSYNQATQLDYFPVAQNLGYSIDLILVPPSLSTVVPRGDTEVVPVVEAVKNDKPSAKSVLPSGDSDSRQSGSHHSGWNWNFRLGPGKLPGSS